MSDEQETMTVNLRVREMGGDVSLRQVALGYQPIVIIEPELDEENDEVSFSIDSTGLNQEELADVLEGILVVLRNGREAE